MKISVVITCYNKAEYIQQAVESALAQHGVHEIIVVDDASTDGSAEILQRVSGAEVLLNANNLGVTATTRIGVERAISGGCQFVALLDGDDVFAPHTIEHYDHALNSSGAEAVYSKCARDRHIDMRDKAEPCDIYAALTTIDDPLEYYLRKPFATTAVCANPAIMLKDITDRARVQDYQIAFSICNNAKLIAFSDAVTHYFSVAKAGQNISEDAIAILTANVTVYMHTYQLALCKKGFEHYQKRSYTRSIRLRHYPVLPLTTRAFLYIFAPFKLALPTVYRHKIISIVYHSLLRR